MSMTKRRFLAALDKAGIREVYYVPPRGNGVYGAWGTQEGVRLYVRHYNTRRWPDLANRSWRVSTDAPWHVPVEEASGPRLPHEVAVGETLDEALARFQAKGSAGQGEAPPSEPLEPDLSAEEAREREEAAREERLNEERARGRLASLIHQALHARHQISFFQARLDQNPAYALENYTSSAMVHAAFFDCAMQLAETYRGPSQAWAQACDVMVGHALSEFMRFATGGTTASTMARAMHDSRRLAWAEIYRLISGEPLPGLSF